MSGVVSLGVWDYVLFAIMLVISAAIGIYSACSGDRQRTTDEYLLGNRQMHVVPVAMSMMITYVSAMSVLGLPGEIYMFNTMFMWNTVGYGIGALISSQMFVPLFFKLELTSIYEYLELRFNKTIRVVNMLIFFFQTLFYMGMVIYTPALALNAATGMSLSVSIFSTGIVCIFYTTIGGLKAVLWTDTFQTFVMVAGIIAIIIAGSLELGGFDEVWAKATEGGRIVFFDMRTDLTVRNTFWTVNIGTIMITYQTFGMNQAIVQRCISLGSAQKAKWAIGLAVFAEWFVLILMGISGVVMYAYYSDCDPYTEGKVFSPDQYPIIWVERTRSRSRRGYHQGDLAKARRKDLYSHYKSFVLFLRSACHWSRLSCHGDGRSSTRDGYVYRWHDARGCNCHVYAGGMLSEDQLQGYLDGNRS
eukprot:XP_011662744.1 PREDICTED: sodium-coupled monocarboxylate transporter 2 isoform X1 [Strongylocentrotus purpuratus]